MIELWEGVRQGDQLARAALADWYEEAGIIRLDENSIGMRFLPIPHTTAPFYLGAYQVTQAEYREITGKSPSYFAATGPGREYVDGLDTSNFPVECVSWGDASAFCHKLSELPAEKIAGRSYRLPTEDEWEYACRAGTTTQFSFGDAETDLGRHAWFAGNSGDKTHPVGKKTANAWGLHDMYGNVWEWAKSLDDGSLECVLRGGSWRSFGGFCRSALRFWSVPVFRAHYIGFRLAAEIVGAY